MTKSSLCGSTNCPGSTWRDSTTPVHGRGQPILRHLLLRLVQRRDQPGRFRGRRRQRQFRIFERGARRILAQRPEAFGRSFRLFLAHLLGFERGARLFELRLGESAVELRQEIALFDRLALFRRHRQRRSRDGRAHGDAGLGRHAAIDGQHLRHASGGQRFRRDALGLGLPGALPPAIGARAGNHDRQQHEPAPAPFAAADGLGRTIRIGHGQNSR